MVVEKRKSRTILGCKQTIWNALRFTLGIFSGKIIFNFARGVVEKNGICSAAFCESAALRAGARSPLGELSRSD